MKQRFWGFCLALTLALAAAPALAADPGDFPVGEVIDFSEPALEGGRLDLNEYRGRVVLLDFFATWCRPCRAALQKADHLNDTYGKHGLSVLGYSLDEATVSRVRPFITELGVKFPVALGGVKKAQALANVHYLPTSLVIDPQGKVVARFVGFTSPEKLMEVIRPYLKGDPPPPPASSRIHRWQKGDKRFHRVWVSEDMSLGQDRGLFVHIMAEISDLPAAQGVWMALHLEPRAKAGAATVPLGGAKTLYQRIDEPWRKHFILFVRCDQLPQAPDSGVYRSWVTVLNAKQKEVGKSGEMMLSLDRSCRGARPAQAPAAQAPSATTAPAAAAKDAAPAEAPAPAAPAATPAASADAAPAQPKKAAFAASADPLAAAISQGWNARTQGSD